jgi:lipoate-protein ligase A
LNFTLVLSVETRPEVVSIQGSYDYILGRIVKSLDIPMLQKAGISDLALGDLKVSGNAQRRHKRYILHHGTLLYKSDVEGFSIYIKEPDDRPEYRGSRSHTAFVTNLDVSRETLTDSITSAFNARDIIASPEIDLMEKTAVLAEEKYAQESWIRRK